MAGLLQACFGNGGAAGTGTSTRRTNTFGTYWLLNNTSVAVATQPVNHAVTISDWRLRLTVAPGVGITRTFTVWKNGGATALSIAITGTGQTGSDLSNSVSFAAGDTTYVEMVTTGGTPADTLAQSVFGCENPDYYTTLCGFGEATQSLASTGTVYNGLLYGGEWAVTPARLENVVAVGGTVTGYRITLSNAPGAAASGKLRTFVIEKNGTAQDGTGGTPNTTITISETATSGTATFTLTVAAGDLFRVKATATLTPVTTAALGTATFVATTLGQYNLGGTSDDIHASAATEYIQAFGNYGIGGNAWFATESLRENIGPETPLTVSGLYVSLVIAPGAGNSNTYTLRKNAAGTAQTVTISDTATTGGPSGGAAVTLTNADRASFEAVPVSVPTLDRVRFAYLMTDPTSVLGGNQSLLVSP